MRRARLALRLDDVGAGSKQHERYGRSFGFAPVGWVTNLFFLKSLGPLRGWGPYREMTAAEWLAVYRLLEEHDAAMTVAVTATWVTGDARLVPFPDRFPDEAAVLREGVEAGRIEIANHGLTHCVLQGDAFRPRLLRGNRSAHREFWDWIPREVQDEHLRRSQEILHGCFGVEIVTFVPPGNVFSEATLELAASHGLRFVSCRAEPREVAGVRVLGNIDTVAFHDRELVLEGVGWLERVLNGRPGARFCTVRDLAEAAEVRSA